MGSADFTHYQAGTSAIEALREAADQARYERGHDGYTGSIGEKGECVVLPGGVRTAAEARELAQQHIDQGMTSQYCDKWGPCGAIPVKTPTRTVTVENVSGFATETVDAATKACAAQNLLLPGETIADAVLNSYSYDERSRDRRRPFANGRLTVTITKTPEALEAQTTPDGWLFFGCAPE
jgi:hypothetical protein